MKNINQFCDAHLAEIIWCQIGVFIGFIIGLVLHRRSMAATMAATQSEHYEAYRLARKYSRRDGFKEGALETLRSINNGPDALREFLSQHKIKGNN